MNNILALSDLRLELSKGTRRGNRPLTYSDALALFQMNLPRQWQTKPYGVALCLQSRRQSIDDDEHSCTVWSVNRVIQGH